MKKIIFLFALLFCIYQTHAAITIGQGPVLQNSQGATSDKRGVSWYEEFQDWESSDLRALDTNGDAYNFFDGHDTARDIIAFYSREEGDNYYFRLDFFDTLYESENNNLDVYLTIDCAAGGAEWFPDWTDTKGDTNHPWEMCIKLYSASFSDVVDDSYASIPASFLGSYWRSDLDAVEFGITRQSLVDQGWDESSTLHFQVITVRDGTQDGQDGNISGESDVCDAIGTLSRNVGDETGLLEGVIASDSTTGRAKYSVIAHANQSVATKSGTQGHIYSDHSYTNLHPGFIRLLDSAELFDLPVNLHISGTLLMSFLWANQDPSEVGYPDRDGPTFVNRVNNFVNGGPGSIIGGVLAEHIMPYYEGSVNAKSIAQNSELMQHLFGQSESTMKVMHVPERVIRSNTSNPYVDPTGPLDGKTFEEIEGSGFTATYLDEVTHLHWWYYPNEQSNPSWDDGSCGRWAGGQGNDEETYHHKAHKINGVYTFMINDREDQSKFGNNDGGMAYDTRYTLLQKALHPDYAQITLVFDDWEAFAGNSFASTTPNNNADQFHTTLRWAANHPWIEFVNLKDAASWAEADPNWVIDQGYQYDKPTQTYEWLKRASEYSYDNWYYGGTLEENFFERVPVMHWGSGGPWTPSGMKKYGDMNTPGTLMRDSWDTIQQITSPYLKKISEWSYSAMIYETAWHDEDANPDQYKSRNYQDPAQGGFTRGTFEGNCDASYDDTTSDTTSSWALRLHAHVRDMGVMKAASDWIENIKNGTQTQTTTSYAADIDDDTAWEYVLCNDRVFLCFERWGARLIKAFVYDEFMNGGDARELIGVPISNPAEEHENEGADNNRCSVFKDRYNSGLNGNHYVDMDFASSAPVQTPNSWAFTSSDGNITKTITLADGKDIVLAEYSITPAVGELYTRHGLGPNQLDLMFNGSQNLTKLSDSTYRGLKNAQGGEAYVVIGANCAFVNGSIERAGWENRELPLVEQFETFNPGAATNFSVAIAFSQQSAEDLDGDGLSNEDEMNIHGSNHQLADTDADGMPDSWEVSNNLLPATHDAQDDADNDGADNLSEYHSGTDPQSPSSVLKITQITINRDITYPTLSNHIYALQFTDDYVASNNTWSILNTWTNNGSPQDHIVTDASIMPGAYRIYRIQAQKTP